MSMTAQASNTKNYVNDLNGGVASILDPGSKNSTEVINDGAGIESDIPL